MKARILILISALFVVLWACGGSSTPDVTVNGNNSGEETASNEHPGKALYKQYCVTCHGADGKLGLNGAMDLTMSLVPRKEAINQVTNGKGMMTPFKDLMTEEEIEQVVDYTITMRELE